MLNELINTAQTNTAQSRHFRYNLWLCPVFYAGIIKYKFLYLQIKKAEEISTFRLKFLFKSDFLSLFFEFFLLPSLLI